MKLKHTGLVFTALFILLGVGTVGYFIGKTLKPASTEAPTKAESKPEELRSYVVVSPSIGPIHTVIDVPLADITSKTASATLNNKGITIKPGKTETLLLDQGGTILPFTATVSNFDFENNMLTLDMPILDADQIPVTGQIVTYQNYNARRLPVSALLDNTIWRVTRDPETPSHGKVEKIEIKNTPKNKDLFDAGTMVRTSNLIIMNPDNNLKDGMTIKIEIGDFPAPLRLPADQAHFDYLEDQKQNTEIELCLHPSLDCKKQ